ncbi:pca operon transcription factor PcaQ [Paracoccus mangrovi]|uniref:Pca operon transcription factor PcaQ n=1 Tax=Paracoccus mangrovi TaxID=1715645 RepID=A0ABV7R5C4_9RHOB
MDRRIKIRHLQAFVEITRRKSLKRAAERLLLTQPAMSRTLSELEEILGATLLERGRGGVALTAQGEFFLGFAQASLSALERGLDGMQGFGPEARLRLRVGALPSVAARLMPEVMEDLARTAPEMRLTIADGSHAHLIGLLNRGELDVVLGRMGEPETMRGISFTQLYLEEVAMVVRPGHPILADPDLRRIGEWPVIYPPEKSAIRPFVRRLLVAEGVALPPDRVETVSGDFGRARTRGSDSIWIISTGVVAREIAEGTLVRLPFDMGITRGPVGLMMRAAEDDTAERRLFAQALERTIARLGLAI